MLRGGLAGAWQRSLSLPPPLLTTLKPPSLAPPARSTKQCVTAQEAPASSEESAGVSSSPRVSSSVSKVRVVGGSKGRATVWTVDPAPRELTAEIRARRTEERRRRKDAETKPWYGRHRHARQSSDQPDRTLTRQITFFAQRRQLDKIFELLCENTEAGRPPNRISLNAAIEACIHCGDVDRALQVLAEMEEADGPGADAVTYGTIIKGLGQAGRLDYAFALVERLDSTRVHLLSLLNACAEAGDAARARAVMFQLRQRFGVSTLAYNVLLKAYSRSTRPQEADRILQEMISAGVQPDRISYNAVLSAAVRGGDLNRARAVVNEMREAAEQRNDKSLLPNASTYTTLVKGLAAADEPSGGGLEAVRAVAEEMQSGGCALDRIAYTALVDAFAATGAVEEACTILTRMEGMGFDNAELRPRAHAYLSVMRALAEMGDADLCETMSQRMVEKAAGRVGPPERSEADELCVEAAANAGQLQRARLRLFEMEQRRGSLMLSARAYKALLRLNLHGEWDVSNYQPYIFKDPARVYSMISSIMVTADNAGTVQPDDAVSSIAGRFFDLYTNALPVADQRGKCVGMLEASACTEVNPEARVSDVMQPLGDAFVDQRMRIVDAGELLAQHRAEVLPVVDSQDGALLGIVRRIDVFASSHETSSMLDHSTLDYTAAAMA
eukprot:jgi/Chlat1/848/Chrsp104S01190